MGDPPPISHPDPTQSNPTLDGHRTQESYWSMSCPQTNLCEWWWFTSCHVVDFFWGCLKPFWTLSKKMSAKCMECNSWPERESETKTCWQNAFKHHFPTKERREERRRKTTLQIEVAMSCEANGFFMSETWKAQTTHSLITLLSFNWFLFNFFLFFFIL